MVVRALLNQQAMSTTPVDVLSYPPASYDTEALKTMPHMYNIGFCNNSNSTGQDLLINECL